MNPFTFEAVYAENINWQNNFTTEEINSILKKSYSKYYDKQGKINRDLLQKGICNAESKAKDLFKNLYKISFKVKDGNLEDIISSEIMEQIQSKYGKEIFAHGVEEAKGGLYNILMMLTAGKIYASAQQGPLQNGLPNISSLNHGPYYLIYESPLSKHASNPTKNLDFDKIEHILVPFQKIIDELHTKSETLLSQELIDKGQRKKFLSKIVTYAQFKKALDVCDELRKAPTSENQQLKLFSNSSPKKDAVVKPTSIPRGYKRLKIS